MDLRAVYSEKYLPRNLRIQSPSTRKHYRITLDQFEEHLGRRAELADLADETIQGFAKWMLEEKELSPATINQRLGYLAALWRWCAKNNLVVLWPSFNLLSEPEEIPRAWNERQLSVLMLILSQIQGDIAGIPASAWWTNLHQFLWESGERIGAVLQITWEMVDRHACTVDVPAKIRKGKAKGMLYRLSPELMASLRKMKRPGHDELFPWPHCEATLYNRYDRILQRAGLPHDRKSKFHRMRKSFASHLDAAGGDATKEFRHSSAKITQRNYLDPSIAKGVPSYQLLPKLGEMKREP
jgi:integrase